MDKGKREGCDILMKYNRRHILESAELRKTTRQISKCCNPTSKNIILQYYDFLNIGVPVDVVSRPDQQAPSY